MCDTMNRKGAVCGAEVNGILLYRSTSSLKLSYPPQFSICLSFVDLSGNDTVVLGAQMFFWRRQRAVVLTALNREWICTEQVSKKSVIMCTCDTVHVHLGTHVSDNSTCQPSALNDFKFTSFSLSQNFSYCF